MQPVSAFSPDTHSAADVVAALNLQPLDQEGGWFRRTAEAGLWVKPVETGGPRRAWSAIYALFTSEGFSALHRLAQDEIWCWHAGDTLESLRLGPETGSGGEDGWVRIGLQVSAGETLQDVVRAGTWQGTRLVAGGRWALVSCVVAPEFRWEEFELGDRAALSAAYPQWYDAITGLTRDVENE